MMIVCSVAILAQVFSLLIVFLYSCSAMHLTCREIVQMLANMMTMVEAGIQLTNRIDALVDRYYLFLSTGRRDTDYNVLGQLCRLLMSSANNADFSEAVISCIFRELQLLNRVDLGCPTSNELVLKMMSMETEVPGEHVTIETEARLAERGCFLFGFFMEHYWGHLIQHPHFPR